MFIVSVGMVEKWLAGLAVGASKRNWLPAMFARLGSDPEAAELPSGRRLVTSGTSFAAWAFGSAILGGRGCQAEASPQPTADLAPTGSDPQRWKMSQFALLFRHSARTIGTTHSTAFAQIWSD